jgi:DNA-binding HxlR family transcriptional regulator
MKHDFACGSDVALAVVGGKWKSHILLHLAASPKRLGELRRLVAGIKEKALIQQLKELEADGIVSRTDHREIPPGVIYAMTSFRRTLASALVPLCTWGDTQRSQVEEMKRIQEQREPTD